MARDDIDVLRQLIREKRDEPPPEVDWDRVEQQLMEKVESDAPAPLPRPSPWPALALVAAAAAVVIAGIGLLNRSSHQVTATSAPAAQKAPVARVLRAPSHHIFGVSQTKLSGDKLAVGDRVVAGAQAVQVEHAGRATWTLSPGSRATVALVGRYLTVRLETGSVTADVVPSPRPESFAVEVKGTRVAVHGTHFTVQRLGDHAKVTLERGVVAVGPASERGHTQGWLMTAPATGTFSLDGASTGYVEQRKPAPEGTTAARTPAPAPAAPAPAKAASAQASEEPGPLPLQPTDDELARGAEQVAATVRSCFAKHTESDQGVRISAHSKLSIDIAAGGNIRTLHFNPPLAPSVQRCSAGVMQSVHFPASTQGATVTRTLELQR